MGRPGIHIRRTYDETMRLLIEARNYATYRNTTEHGVPTTVALRATCESFRVTARLSHVMAWALARMAVHAGELTPAQCTLFTLSVAGACAQPSGPEDESLPQGLRSLLDRSHRLYLRVTRLDQQMQHGEHRDASSSEVRSLTTDCI